MSGPRQIIIDYSSNHIVSPLSQYKRKLGIGCAGSWLLSRLFFNWQHQGQLIDAYSGIEHRKARGSVVRTRRLGPRRTRGTEVTEILALKKMVVSSKPEFPKKVLNSTTNPYAPSVRKVQ